MNRLTLKINFKAVFLAALIPLIISGCYPGGPETVSDYDLVGSVYDTETNFTELVTYAIPDTVIVISDGSETIDHSSDQLIINEIKRNLEYLGYVQEPDPENNTPDIIVTASAWKNLNAVYDYYNYWGWYGGWGWGGGWNPWYPWYGPGYGTVYTYETGTLLIEMFDLKNADESSELIPEIWIGALNGLLEGSNANKNNRIKTAIGDVFQQSPYLRGDK